MKLTISDLFLYDTNSYMTHYVESPVYYEVYQLALQRRGLAVPPYEALVHNGSLLLLNSHPLLGQALPLPNNAKYVAGHHIHGSAGTLPKVPWNYVINNT